MEGIGLPFFSPLVERAMRVAAAAHRDQCRKASDLPYITHPASVAILLLRAGIDDECILAAALLHDVVEDTSYGANRLAAEFPAEVQEYVAAMTERKLSPDGRKRMWRDRKLEHVAQVASAPWQARAIVLADKLHNVGTMLYDLEEGAALWTRFNASPEQILWYHRSMLEAADQGETQLAKLAGACREALAALQSVIPRLG